MIAKLIDGVIYTPTEGERQKIVITNPTNESLKFNLGYKDYEIDEQPEYDPETQYLEPYYEETEDKIIKHWEVKEIPEPIEEEVKEIEGE